MAEASTPITILMADDDQGDRRLTREAFRQQQIASDLRFVENGEQLIDYLLRQGEFTNPSDSPRPGLILLDLNMPRKNGHEALREIKSHPELCSIPVIILTTSKSEEDILRSYELGAASFITKPVTFDGLAEIVQALDRYWLKVVTLPHERQ